MQMLQCPYSNQSHLTKFLADRRINKFDVNNVIPTKRCFMQAEWYKGNDLAFFFINVLTVKNR